LAPKPINKSTPLGYNPIWRNGQKRMGTIAYRGPWDAFDQIMVSIANSKWLHFFSVLKAGIYNKSFDTNPQYKGYPKRHSATEIGFSDHFPVYIYLIKMK
jgi:hypothetical protein